MRVHARSRANVMTLGIAMADVALALPLARRALAATLAREARRTRRAILQMGEPR